MSDTPKTDPPPSQSGSAADRAQAAPPGGPDLEDPVDELAAREERPGAAEPGQDGAEEPGQAGAAAGKSRRTRLLLEAAAGALVLALVAGGVAGGRVLGWWGATAGPAPAPTSTPTPAESPMASPFAGTPAEDFAEGAAGIVLPAAEAVGEFTAEEVSEALAQVRQALIAARLDETMLIDHNPDEFLSLLAPDHQLGLRPQFDEGEFGSYATQIAPGVELAPVSPRVYGTVTYEATTVEGDLPALEVSTAFVWWYAFTGGQATGPDAVAVRDQMRWEVVGDERWVESSRGLWLADARSEFWAAVCDEDGRIRPTDTGTVDLDEAPSGFFNPGQPIEDVPGC